MRTIILSVILPLALSACVNAGPTPSLAPRPIEKLVGAADAAPTPAVSIPADAATAAKVVQLLADARTGDAAFVKADREGARAFAAGRGAAQGSDRWIEGETARSALEAARQQSADALAALDALLVAAASGEGGGFSELEGAQREAGDIVARQTARIDALSR